MNNKFNKYVIILSIGLMCLGACISAKPVYHYVSWKMKEVRGIIVWKKWQNSKDPLEDGIKPAFWLKIPETGINTLVISDPNKENLLKYPCLLPLETDVDDRGIKLIMAHRDMHFRKLENIQVDDVVGLEYRDRKVKHFAVMETEILTPEKVSSRLNEKSREEWLVLLTCYPFKYIGPAPKRFLVWAKAISDR